MTLPTEDELKKARGHAVDLKLAADVKQNEADKVRRQADSAMLHYHRLLEEFQGQLSIDTEAP